MKNSLKSLFILPSFLFLYFPLQAQEYNSLLWKITKPGTKNTSYLFGTIHFYDTSLFKIPDTLFTLIKKSQKVALELDLDKAASLPLNIFIEDTSKSVKDFISDSSFQKLKRIVNDNAMLRLFGDKIFRMKPVLIGSFIGLPEGGMSNSIDMELFNFAKKEKKAILGLETAAEQMESLNQLSNEEQGKYLEKAISGFSSQGNELKEILKVYMQQKGDSLLEKIEDTDASGSFNKELVTTRNHRLAERALPDLEKNTMFIAIGAAHLPGKEGVIEIFRSKGYKVTPLKLIFKTSVTKAKH